MLLMLLQPPLKTRDKAFPFEFAENYAHRSGQVIKICIICDKIVGKRFVSAERACLEYTICDVCGKDTWFILEKKEPVREVDTQP